MEKQDLTQWLTIPTPSLIEYIENHFHARLRASLPETLALFEKVASRHGDSSPNLKEALQLYRELTYKMPLHLLREEQVLFPMLLAADKNRDQPPVSVTSVPFAIPLAPMKSEHDEDLEILKKIRESMNDFMTPEHACRSYQQLLRALQDITSDLKQHIALENEVLFERFKPVKHHEE